MPSKRKAASTVRNRELAHNNHVQAAFASLLGLDRGELESAGVHQAATDANIPGLHSCKACAAREAFNTEDGVSDNVQIEENSHDEPNDPFHELLQFSQYGLRENNDFPHKSHRHQDENSVHPEEVLDFASELDAMSPADLSSYCAKLSSYARQSGHRYMISSLPELRANVKRALRDRIQQFSGSAAAIEELSDSDSEVGSERSTLPLNPPVSASFSGANPTTSFVATPTLPSSAPANVMSSNCLSQYIHWTGTKHWLLLKEGIHIVLDRLLSKNSSHLASKCPLYARLSRAEKRAAVLKFATALVLKQPLKRDVIVDAVSACVYEACEQEALLETPAMENHLSSNNKKRGTRMPFMQKVMGEAISELIGDKSTSSDCDALDALLQSTANEATIIEAVERMRDIWLSPPVAIFFESLSEPSKPPAIVYCVDVEQAFGMDYFLPPPPEFSALDERLLIDAIRIDEEDAGKETVFAANLKKALKLVRQSTKQRSKSSTRNRMGPAAAATSNEPVATTDGGNAVGIMLQQLYQMGPHSSGDDADRGEDSRSAMTSISDLVGDQNLSPFEKQPDWWLEQPWVARYCRVPPEELVSALKHNPSSWYDHWKQMSFDQRLDLLKLSANEACDVIDSHPLWLSLRGMVGCNLFRDGVWPIISNDGHLSCVKFRKDSREEFWFIDRANIDLTALFPSFLSWARSISCGVRIELQSLAHSLDEGKNDEVSRAVQGYLESAIVSFMLLRVVAHAIEMQAEAVADVLGGMLIEAEEEERSKGVEVDGIASKSKKSRRKAKQKARKRAAEDEKRKRMEDDRRRQLEEEQQRREKIRIRQAEQARQREIERQRRVQAMNNESATQGAALEPFESDVTHATPPNREKDDCEIKNHVADGVVDHSQRQIRREYRSKDDAHTSQQKKQVVASRTASQVAECTDVTPSVSNSQALRSSPRDVHSANPLTQPCATQSTSANASVEPLATATTFSESFDNTFDMSSTLFPTGSHLNPGNTAGVQSTPSTVVWPLGLGISDDLGLPTSQDAVTSDTYRSQAMNVFETFQYTSSPTSDSANVLGLNTRLGFDLGSAFTSQRTVSPSENLSSSAPMNPNEESTSVFSSQMESSPFEFSLAPDATDPSLGLSLSLGLGFDEPDTSQSHRPSPTQ